VKAETERRVLWALSKALRTVGRAYYTPGKWEYHICRFCDHVPDEEGHGPKCPVVLIEKALAELDEEASK